MKKKKRLGDRRDGTLVRNLDSMHFIMPLIYPNRCDNEAYISECIDLTNVNEYLAQKNAQNPEYFYNLFQVIVTALLKTITLRPKMNRFIANGNLYQRNEVCASFVIKKIFSDSGEEGMAFIHVKDDDTIDTIHNEIYRQVSHCRDENTKDSSTQDAMDLFNKLPRFISKAIIKFICVLERRGLVPKSLVAADPYYSSVILSNLGSIKLHAGYHHLTNWGTTSIFVIVGERKKRPFYDDEGNIIIPDVIEDEEEDPEDAPTEEETVPEEETDPQDGWDQEHVFYYEDGEPAKGLKLLVDNNYYYFDPETGEKQTGWVEIEGAWHYFTEEGPAPGVGWYSDDVGWFYLEVDGKHHLESFTEDNRSYTLDEAGYLMRMEYTELDCIESEDTVDGTKRPILMIPGTLSNCTGLTYRLVETGSITALDAPIWEIWICQEGEWSQVKEVSVSEEEGGYILSFGQPQSFEAICIVAPKDHRVDSTLRSVVLDF